MIQYLIIHLTDKVNTLPLFWRCIFSFMYQIIFFFGADLYLHFSILH